MTTRNEIEAVEALRQQLVNNGYKPVAVRTGQKAPVGFGWQKAGPDITAKPDALNTGILCGQVIAADIDIDDLEAVNAARSALEQTIGLSPVARVRPNSSRQLMVYRAPPGVELRKRIIPMPGGKVEILANGQQFVAYGVHPSGAEFRWPLARPDETPLDDLPEITVEGLDRLSSMFAKADEPPAPAPEPVVKKSFTTATAPGMEERGRAYAETALDNAVREVAATPKGLRSDTLNTISFKIGTLVGAGWLSMSEAHAALCAAVSGWENQMKTKGTITRALRDGSAQPHPPLEDREQSDEMLERGQAIARQLDAADIGEDEEEEEEEPDAAPPQDMSLLDMPDDLLHPPGLVGEIADWACATARKEHRLFGVAAALTIVGALVARRVFTEDYTGTQLFTLILAGSGGGKDRYKNVVEQVLSAAGRQRQIMGKAASSPAIQLKLQQVAAQVQVIDEIAGVFDTLNDNRSSSHQKAIADTLCQLWSTTIGDFTCDTTTTRSTSQIVRPWFGLFGATTQESFRPQMRSKAILSGFWNRFLFLPKYTRVQTKKAENALELPDGLVASMQSLMTSDDESGPKRIEASAEWGNANIAPKARIIKAETGAQAIFDRMGAREEQLMEEADVDPMLVIWQRSTEMAMRVALILACGRHCRSMENCRITREDAEFAERLVVWSKETFLREIRMHMAENQSQADYLSVMNIIKGRGTISRSDLNRTLKGRIRLFDLDNILKQIEIAGHIARVERKEAKKGRPPTAIFKWLD